jgi:hypothetical protein
MFRLGARRVATAPAATEPSAGPAIGARAEHKETPMASEDQIRNCAHLLWEKAGKPQGRDAEFWHAAEAELNAEDENPDAAGAAADQPNKRTVPG